MNGEYEPKILICIDCNEEFVFTVDAQKYLAGHRRMGDPKRCKSCHRTFKKGLRNSDHQPDTSSSH